MTASDTYDDGEPNNKDKEHSSNFKIIANVVSTVTSAGSQFGEMDDTSSESEPEVEIIKQDDDENNIINRGHALSGKILASLVPTVAEQFGDKMDSNAESEHSDSKNEIEVIDDKTAPVDNSKVSNSLNSDVEPEKANGEHGPGDILGSGTEMEKEEHSDSENEIEVIHDITAQANNPEVSNSIDSDVEPEKSNSDQKDSGLYANIVHTVVKGLNEITHI